MRQSGAVSLPEPSRRDTRLDTYVDAYAERTHGLTVSAFASVSPEPPLVLVSIDHRATACELLETAGAVFAVNILGHDQMEMSNRFAWLKDEDRFGQGEWTTAATGAPILRDALAWLDCTVYSRFSAGSHTCLLYTSPSPRDGLLSRMPSSA